MKIEIKDIELNNKWDYQKAKLLLRWDGLDSSSGLTVEQRENLQKEITLFLWTEIKKYFPEIEEYCTGQSRRLNKCESRHYGTPIINIHGSFYMQYITKSTAREWSWESIELDPYRFYFNEDGYLKGLFTEIENKARKNNYTMLSLSEKISRKAQVTKEVQK